MLSQVKAALKKGNTPPTDHPLRKVFEECVESVEPVQLEAAAQQTLLAHLGEADLKISDQFFESPAGAKFFVRDKPPSAQERELLDFLATSASEKLRVAMTTPAGRAPINKKIEDLVAACGAAHQGKSS